MNFTIALYLKLKGVLEIFGGEVIVSMHLHSILAGVGHHYTGYTLGYGFGITRQVNVQQSLPINDTVILLDALSSAASPT